MSSDAPLLGTSGGLHGFAFILMVAVFPAYIASGFISGNPHQPSLALTCILAFLLWFIVSYLFSAILFRTEETAEMDR